jgi:transcription elongation factor SPT6
MDRYVDPLVTRLKTIIMDRYVDPLVTHLKTMLNYRKFGTGTKIEVDELLKIEKAEYPMRIVYSFGIS